jgi:hypothetical protein
MKRIIFLAKYTDRVSDPVHIFYLSEYKLMQSCCSFIAV